jgi:hypothetical protein
MAEYFSAKPSMRLGLGRSPKLKRSGRSRPRPTFWDAFLKLTHYRTSLFL